MSEYVDISLRDEIYDNLVTTLEGISVANGYKTDPQYIEEDEIKMPSQIPGDKFPALMVFDTDEDKTNAEAQETSCVLKFVISGYVKSNMGGESVKLQIRKLLRDVETAIMVDPRRGYYAYTTAVSTIRTDKGTMAPFGVFDMELAVNYSYQKGKPDLH